MSDSTPPVAENEILKAVRVDAQDLAAVENKPVAGGGVAAWATTPKAQLLSLLLGIFGTVFGFYAYVQGKQVPELTYATQPVQATILRSGELSKLGVTFDGKPLTSDITAAQVAIWNAGSKAVRPGDVVTPLELQIEEQTQILDVSLRRKTRDALGVKIDESGFPQGRVGLSFRILEPEDGFVVQVTYAGKAGRKLALKGDVEGQRGIEQAQITQTTDPGRNYEPVSSAHRIASAILVFFLASLFALLFATGLFSLGMTAWAKRTLASRTVAIALLAGAGAIAFLYVLTLYGMTQWSKGPPFEF